MDINGWLTVITVFTAIFALLPREDLVLSFQRTNKIEKWLVFAILLFVIPYLIVFPQLTGRWPELKKLGFSWGFAPANIAFALFFLCFLWLLLRLFFIKPNGKANSKTIEYYLELLSEKSFEEFFKIFTKYTSPKEINKNWNNFEEIVFQPKFLNGVSNYQPTYLLQFWDNFSSEEDFQSIFRLFLENQNSAYYKEIKEHWNSYSLLSDKPFLNNVLKDNLQQSIHNNLIPIVSDFALNHLHLEHDKTSIYNQPHFYSKIREEEGYDLPIYYHIRFIGLLYSSAIRNKVDISTLSHRNTNMQFIFSTMVNEMINNVQVNDENFNKEYPTNYHWLIGEIFSITVNWVSNFGNDYYSEKSSYNTFIPFSFSLSMDELYKGFERNKISQGFINSMIYYHMLSNYFDFSIKPDFKSSIEDEVISRIPEKHLKPILKFALNERFAINYENFVTGKFGFLNKGEKEILDRLLAFLKNNKKLP
jgi:hypothetical protein